MIQKQFYIYLLSSNSFIPQLQFSPSIIHSWLRLKYECSSSLLGIRLRLCLLLIIGGCFQFLVRFNLPLMTKRSYRVQNILAGNLGNIHVSLSLMQRDLLLGHFTFQQHSFFNRIHIRHVIQIRFNLSLFWIKAGFDLIAGYSLVGLVVFTSFIWLS